ALVHGHEAADHGEKRGFAGAIGADDGGDAPGRQRQTDAIDHGGRAIGFGDLAGDDHRAALRRTRAMKTMPPRNSMMIDKAVSNSKTRSSRVWPPTRQTTASRTAAGRT